MKKMTFGMLVVCAMVIAGVGTVKTFRAGPFIQSTSLEKDGSLDKDSGLDKDGGLDKGSDLNKDDLGKEDLGREDLGKDGAL